MSSNPIDVSEDLQVASNRDLKTIQIAHDFSRCRGVKNGPVFIIASGASAKGIPLGDFADIPMITMNGAVSKFANTGISPFFYVCTDRDFANQQPDLFATAMQISENVALWADQLSALRAKPSGCVYTLKKAPRRSVAALFKKNPALVRKRSLLSKRCRDIGFSKDMDHGFFDARTVMYLALQLAYHVGFNQVFLVGFDLDQSAGRFYEKPTDKCSPCGLDQHFQSRILPSLELMSERVVDVDFQVFNLSLNSKAPERVIPKVKLDQVRLMLTP
jgi:KDO transferase-3